MQLQVEPIAQVHSRGLTMASTTIVVSVASSSVLTLDESTAVDGLYERAVAFLPEIAALRMKPEERLKRLALLRMA